jgi:DNA-binding transcriptional regulator LsrR (DeoR family)
VTPEQRKQAAERLLNDPTLREAFDVLKSVQVAVFTSTSHSDADVMEARRMVRALGDLETQLNRFILDGKLAERRK